MTGFCTLKNSHLVVSLASHWYFRLYIHIYIHMLKVRHTLGFVNIAILNKNQ